MFSVLSSVSLIRCQLSQYTPGQSGRNVPGGNNRQGASGGGGFGRPGGVSGGRVGGNGGGRGGGGDNGGGDDPHQGLDWLRDSVPGEPGVDYPIFSLPVPDNDFRYTQYFYVF